MSVSVEPTLDDGVCLGRGVKTGVGDFRRIRGLFAAASATPGLICFCFIVGRVEFYSTPIETRRYGSECGWRISISRQPVPAMLFVPRGFDRSHSIRLINNWFHTEAQVFTSSSAEICRKTDLHIVFLEDCAHLVTGAATGTDYPQ